MKQSKTTKGRRFISVMALIIVGIMILSIIIMPVVARGESSGISIRAELGVSGKYKLDVNAPLKVFLENTGDDFEGELQVRMNVSGTSEYMRYNVYAQPVQMPRNSSKVYETEIPVSTVVGSLDVELADKDGNKVGKYTAHAYPVEPGTVLVGVLSDSPNSLTYLRALPLHQYMYDKETNELADNLIFLNEFPENASMLKPFDMLIINDFDTGSLSNEDKKILQDWLKEGGTLAVGTGHNFQKVMKGLDFIDAKVEATFETETPGLAENLPKPLTLNSMHVPEGSFKEGLVLSYYIQQGLGTVILHGFDLGVEPVPYMFSQSNRFLTEDYTTYIQPSTNGGFNREDIFTRFTNNLPSLSDDTIMVSFVILGIWIVFVGPVLYIFLKKKDIREKGFAIIPIMAVLTTFLIYLLGSNGMYKKAIINTFSAVTVMEDSSVSDIMQVSGVLSPYADDIKVDFDKEIPLNLPGNMYYEMDYRSYNDAIEKDVKKILYGAKPSLTFYDKESWGLSTFSSNYTSDVGRLNAELTLDGNVIKGKITNDTKLDFDEIILEFSGMYVKLADKLIQGDSAEVFYPLDFENEALEMYSQISQIFNIDTSRGIQTNERRKNSLKFDLMQMDYEYNMKFAYLNTKPRIQKQAPVQEPSENKVYNVSGEDTGLIKAKITAFSETKINDVGIRVNGDIANEFNTNVFRQGVTVKLGSEGKIDMPYGILGVNTIESISNLEIQNDGIYMYDEGEVTMSWVAPANTETTKFSFMTYTSHNYEIFNVRTGEFEVLSLEQYQNNVQDYFDEEGKLTIRIQGLTTGEYISLPKIKISLIALQPGDR